MCLDDIFVSSYQYDCLHSFFVDVRLVIKDVVEISFTEDLSTMDEIFDVAILLVISEERKSNFYCCPSSQTSLDCKDSEKENEILLGILCLI